MDDNRENNKYGRILSRSCYWERGYMERYFWKVYEIIFG